MRCLEPVTIKVPYKDHPDRFHWVEVPCGKCEACLSRRRDQWVLRLKQEFYNSKKSVFVTLTYNDLSLPKSPDGTPTLKKDDITRFMKRLRKRISKYSDLKIRFFGCGEYGSESNRPHYHILLFNCPENIEKDILASWPLGLTRVDPMNEQRIAYTCKYVLSSSNLVDCLPFTFGSNGINVSSLLLGVRHDQLSAVASLLNPKSSTTSTIVLS